MGANSISVKLQHLIDLKLKYGLHFLFMSDPMHGNTYESK
jgi:3-deoxy-D-arabino-heptulosonate 7-phosphate (DAHP) synthase class II